MNSNVSAKEIKQELARRNLIDFVEYTFPKYEMTWFHNIFIDKVDRFAKGEIKKLMIFIPPQHGKSEISTRRLPCYLLGKNPNLNIAIISYSDTKAKKFNREIKRIINDKSYNEIFPNIRLPNMLSGYTNSANEFEIIDNTGSCKAIGVGGALTGDPVDILIMDDLYKDAMSAWSEIIRENIENWYDTVADTRLHNDSQQLIVFTRWHHLDLAGKLLKEEADQWEVIKFEAIKENESDYDVRNIGDALWEEKHSLKKLIQSRNRNPHVFQSLFQQNPKPLEGLLYKEFKTYETLPKYHIVKNYTDTADTGGDYLCSITYIEYLNMFYVIDVIYTKKPNEYTEPLQAQKMKDLKVNECRVESNAGGRAYARNVERLTKEKRNYTTTFIWFYQSKNKEARIKSNSSTVNNTIVMPNDWHIRWADFYNDVANYMATGKNKNDDAPDVLTGIIETKIASQEEYL